MSSKIFPRAISIAVGGTLAAGMAIAPSAYADQNPFSVTELSAGYLLAENAPEAQCGGAKAEKMSEMKKDAAEANCGAKKEPAESKCGAKEPAEAKCGAKG
jgi:hypothetical protein